MKLATRIGARHRAWPPRPLPTAPQCRPTLLFADRLLPTTSFHLQHIQRDHILRNYSALATSKTSSSSEAKTTSSETKTSSSETKTTPSETSKTPSSAEKTVEEELGPMEPQSQAERYLRYLQMDMAAEEHDRGERVKLVPRRDASGVVVKLPMTTRLKDACVHTYHGFRLLALETRIASRLLWRKLKGNALTRNEQRQFDRTVTDLIRMVPFSLFIIIPMGEAFLPVALWLFPNMLPSTFNDSDTVRKRHQTELDSKIQFAQFLQRTLEDIPLETSDAQPQVKTAEFKRFMARINEEGGYVSKSELLKWMPFFAEHMTLDVLALSQLRALCRLLQVRIMPFSTPAALRWQLKVKVLNLRVDDKAIKLEGGVNVLSIGRLQEACRERGMRALGMSEERLKQQLQQWLELSQNEKVPEAFLLLSRAFYFPEEVQYVDRIKKIMTILPDTVRQEAEQRLSQLEGKKDYKARRQLILAIEQQLKADKLAQAEVDAALEKEKIRVVEKEASEAAAAEAQATLDSLVPLQITTEPLLEVGAESADIAVELSESPIAKADLDAIGDVLLKAAAVREAREDVQELRKHAVEHAEELVVATTTAAQQGVAVRQASKSAILSKRVSRMVDDLEVELTKADTPAMVDKPEMTVDAMMMAIRSRLEEGAIDEARMDRIQQVLAALDDDADGVIDVDMALDVIQLVGVDDVNLDRRQIAELVELLRREEALNVRLKAMPTAAPTTPVSETSVSSHKRSPAVMPASVDPFIPPTPMNKVERRSVTDK